MSTKPKVLGQLELGTFFNIRAERAMVLRKVSDLMNELHSFDNRVNQRIVRSVEKYCSIRVVDYIVGLGVIESLITHTYFVDTFKCGNGAEHCFKSVQSAISEFKTLEQVFAGVASVQVERIGRDEIKIAIRTLLDQ